MTLIFPGGIPEKAAGTDLGFIYSSWIEGIGEFRATCPDGNYRVTLHFAETSSLPDGVPIARPGMRVFAVALQGKTVLTDVDPLAMAGGRGVAAARTFQAEVHGGQLVVGFVKKIGEPLLHALEIEQLPPLPEPPPGKKKRAFVLRVNCGGPWWKDAKGNAWQSPRRFVEGGWGTVGGRAVATLPVKIVESLGLSEGQTWDEAAAQKVAQLRRRMGGKAIHARDVETGLAQVVGPGNAYGRGENDPCPYIFVFSNDCTGRDSFDCWTCQTRCGVFPYYSPFYYPN